ncbi:MAG: ankyrin repeat domain-containing protein, partial [Candidatus Babeliales bacterium]
DVNLFAQKKKEKQKATIVLWKAIKNEEKINNEDMSEIEYAIKLGADINKKDEYDRTPLIYALYNSRSLSKKLNGFCKVARLLIKNYADINITDESGKTPLMHAILQDLEGIITLLIERGANVDIADNNNFTALMYALFSGHIKSVQILFEKSINAKNAIDKQDDNKKTPLDYALITADTEMIKFLITNKPTEDAKIKEFIANNPVKWQQRLFESINSSDFNKIKFIIQFGINLNVVDNNEWTPLQIALLSAQYRIADLLITKGSNNYYKKTPSPLTIALTCDQYKIAYLLMKEENFTQEELNIIEQKFSKILTYLDKFGDHDAGQKKEKIKELISKYPSLKNKLQYTLSDSLKNNSEEINIKLLKSLYNYGVNLNYKDELNWTPLFYAIHNGHIQVVRFLLEHQANPNENAELDWEDYFNDDFIQWKNYTFFMENELSYSETPLTIAIKNNDIASIKLLIAYHAKFIENDELTPLEIALIYQRYDIVKLLIESNSHIPKHILIWAITKHDIEIAQLLLKMGADINGTYKPDNSTPLIRATILGETAMVDFCIENGAKIDIAKFPQEVKKFVDCATDLKDQLAIDLFDIVSFDLLT